jgi:phosphate/sulfate permease
MSNIAVFLNRSLNVWELIAVITTIVIGLGILFYQGGEKIQQIVNKKARVGDIPEATLVNVLFAIVLYVFKEWSKIPMSTTWAFIGLLAGRELCFAVRKVAGVTLKDAFKMSGNDLLKCILGFIVSVIVGYGAN